MVHYSTQENSQNLEKSSSHKVCVCARARESLVIVRVRIDHMLPCFLAWFWSFFKCRGSRLSHDLFISIGSYSDKDALHGRRCSVSGEKGTCFDWCYRNKNCIRGNRTLPMSCHASHCAREALVFIAEMHVQQLKKKMKWWNECAYAHTQIRKFYRILGSQCKVFAFIHKAKDLIVADRYLVPPPLHHLFHNLSSFFH